MQNLLWSVDSSCQDEKSEGSSTLGKKAFDDFTEALGDLSCVKSLELIPSENDRNSNPIVTHDCHVGVKSWMVPLIFNHAYRNFIAGTQEDQDTFTRCIVLCCSDCTTAWNMRKELVSSTALTKDSKRWKKELSLTRLALQLHPKSSEAFAHRRWIVSKISDILFRSIMELVSHEDKRPLEKVPEKMAKVMFHDEGNTQTSAIKMNQNTESGNVSESTFSPLRHTDDPVAQTSSQQCEDPTKRKPLGSFTPLRHTVAQTSSQQYEDPTRKRPSGLSKNSPSDALKLKIQDLLGLARNEYSVCRQAGLKQKCNYNAWAHRCWVIDMIIVKLVKKILKLYKFNDLDRTELAMFCNEVPQIHYIFSSKVGHFVCASLLQFLHQDLKELTEFSESHISDISVLNATLHTQLQWTRLSLHLEKNVTKIGNSCDEQLLATVIDVWVRSLGQNSNLLRMYGSHEALWCHRRNIHLAFNKTVRDTLLECNENFSRFDLSFSVENETKFCEEYAKNETSIDKISQTYYTERHLEFCNKFMT